MDGTRAPVDACKSAAPDPHRGECGRRAFL